uniref:Uncharacterized protein n=1 Tax=Panagrellus redivivus TaxID=6233 RepID=A0A7E4UWV8_PANRE
MGVVKNDVRRVRRPRQKCFAMPGEDRGDNMDDIDSSKVGEIKRGTVDRWQDGWHLKPLKHAVLSYMRETSLCVNADAGHEEVSRQQTEWHCVHEDTTQIKTEEAW